MVRSFREQARRRRSVYWLIASDVLGDERCVVLDPTDERRAACVLPREPDEVEAGNLRHTAAVTQAAVVVEDRRLDPRVVRAIARRPDDGVDLELAAILEAHRAIFRIDCSGFHLDAVALPELARTGSDQRLACAQPPAETRVDRLVENSCLRQPPEEVPSEQSLRQRRLA